MEIDRIKSFDDGYDYDKFNLLYKQCRPLVRKLVYTIDNSRLGMDKDMVSSLFDDKIMFIFYKYSKDYDYNRLKSLTLSSLANYRNKLLRKAYGRDSEFYMSQISLDNAYDDIKGTPELDITDNERLESIIEFMKTNLSEDAYLIFTIELYPPEWFIDKLGDYNHYNSFMKFNNYTYLEYFSLPKNTKYAKYISALKQEINNMMINYSGTSLDGGEGTKVKSCTS